jgi:hypothetical protein
MYDGEAVEWRLLQPTLIDLRTPVEASTRRLVKARIDAQRALDEEHERVRAMASDQSLPSDVRTLASVSTFAAWDVDGSEAIETREEFVLAAQIIRDAVDTWRAIQEDRPLAAITAESPLMTALLADIDPSRSARSFHAQAFLDWFFADARAQSIPAKDGSDLARRPRRPHRVPRRPHQGAASSRPTLRGLRVRAVQPHRRTGRVQDLRK